MLAISLFNGMDGIESGQGIGVEDTEMGGIESGGTSVDLADQDAKGDVWYGQDGQGSGLEDVGSRICSGITIQGAGGSSIRTRSRESC